MRAYRCHHIPVSHSVSPRPLDRAKQPARWPCSLCARLLLNLGTRGQGCHTLVQMSDAVAQESVELLLLHGLLEAEVAVPEERLPQVHREFLRRHHEGRGVLLLIGCYGNIENTKMCYIVRLLFKMLISGCEGNSLGQATGRKGGERCLGEEELRVQAPPTSLHQLHLSHASRWPHLLPHRDSQGHQTQSFPTSSHQRNAPTELPLSSRSSASHSVQLCRPRGPVSTRLLCALRSLPPPCHLSSCHQPLFSSQPGSCPSSPETKLLRSLLSSRLPACGFFIICPLNLIGNTCCC